MFKCIRRLYADNLIFNFYIFTHLVTLYYFKVHFLKISAALYSLKSYLPVFRSKKVIFAIFCQDLPLVPYLPCLEIPVNATVKYRGWNLAPNLDLYT